MELKVKQAAWSLRIKLPFLMMTEECSDVKADRFKNNCLKINP